MTIREAMVQTTEVLDTLDKLMEAAGETLKVLRVNVPGDEGPEMHLTEEAMRAVVEAFPEIEDSIQPMGDEWPRLNYWSVDIDGVHVFAIVEEEDE